MKNSNKIISGIVALSLVSSCGVPVFAADKEEVIYVMAGADGSVNSVYAVNSFDGGDITDYGDYTDVKLLNLDGNITQNGDEITFSSPENGKVYYQGTLKNSEIPWDISIKFFLDGKELSAEDAAGKSGSLEIRISIAENEKCSSDFYENYALQCSFTLDTELCKSISAEGATIANVGSKKQITYTVLPGKGLERSVFADVTDFEMAEGSINGIKMSLGLDIDDEDIDKKITDLTDGAKELDDGAKELAQGGSDLADGAKKLMDGAAEMHDGTAELRFETDKIDDTFGDDLSNMLDSMSDENYEVKSFISEKNTEVALVQFVIKTDAIEIPEAVKADTEPEKKLTFWQKLLSLFGLLEG